MPTLFMSQQCRGHRQFAGYRQTVAAHVARVDATPRRSGEFDCQIVAQKVGPVALVEIHSDAVMLSRSSRCIASDPTTHYIVAVQRAGHGVIRHDRAEIRIEPGVLTLLDKALPYEAQFDDHAVRLLICISRLHLERRLPDPERYLRTAVRADRGIGRIAADYAESLLREAPHLDEASQYNAAILCVDLLASALLSATQAESASVPSDGARRASAPVLLSRIKAHIRCHLSAPDLSPSLVADTHGISKRYLHALFASSGTSVGTWIREERLSRAYADLANPRLREVSVTDIALRHGFNDIPHFSRTFKAKYGTTPNGVRSTRDPS